MLNTANYYNFEEYPKNFYFCLQIKINLKMAGVYWREAASLILVGRSHLISRPLQHQMKAKPNIEQDYNILTLQRSSKSSFMPDAVVFPGGAFEKADHDPKWINLFENNGYPLDELTKLLRFDGPKIDFYSNRKEGNILPELAFRICALRETFEESGLLLAIPSVFNLFDWSVWLTPTYYGGLKRRFNTIFYTAFTDSQIPFSEHDEKEIQKLKIDGINNILKLYFEDKILLMPPQIYEFSRFVKFTKFQDFHKFCKEKSSEGLRTMLPVSLKCADGDLHLLPGDELYPKVPNYYKDPELKVDQTLEQLNGGADRLLHRVLLDGVKFKEMFIRNMDSENGNILFPYSSEDLKKLILD
ncbi:Nucleoside diphosphate-linked moiety X motif 19 [Armadillidium vulgare]|nr:Nucleoside diphosphate-linked moiety X motif 19 [Armadillidium vulgare]